MNNKDCEELKHFIERTGMYIGKQNQDNIVSFIHGYECGRNHECGFPSILSEHFEQVYGIEKKALGWPYQITTLAKKLDEDWNTVFKRESLVVINKESNL